MLITIRNLECKIYVIIKLYKFDAITTNKVITLLFKTTRMNNVFN